MPVRMKNPLYRQAIRHGWTLAWHHRWLWPLGLFAALLGQMGVMELLANMGAAKSERGLVEWYSAIRSLFDIDLWKNLSAADGTAFWALWLFVVLAALLFILVFVAVVSQGAIISVAAKRAKQTPHVPVGKAWEVGVLHGWRIFWITLIKRLLVLALGLIMGLVTIELALAPTIGNSVLFFIFLLLALFVGLVVSFLAVYASCYVVVEEYPWWRAIGAAWHLFIEHWLVSLEVALIVLGFNVLIMIVAVLGLYIVFFPALQILFVSAIVGSRGLYLLGLIGSFAIFTLFIMWLGSLFTIFTTSVWTFLFTKMHRHGVPSRIAGFVGHVWSRGRSLLPH